MRFKKQPYSIHSRFEMIFKMNFSGGSGKFGGCMPSPGKVCFATLKKFRKTINAFALFLFERFRSEFVLPL